MISTPHLSGMILISLSILISTVKGCGPGVKPGLDYVRDKFGLEIIEETSYFVNRSAFSNFPISRSSDLKCDMNSIWRCQWKNVEPQDSDPRDQIDFHPFKKVSDRWEGNLLLPGLPPELEEHVLLAGDISGALKSATLLSSPISQQDGEGKLSFQHWLNGPSAVEVLTVVPSSDPLQVLRVLNAPTCGLSALGTRCQVSIPPSQTPFQIGIRAHNIANSLVLIDDIQYEASIFLPTANSLDAPRDSISSSQVCQLLTCDFENPSWCNWSPREIFVDTPTFELFDLPFWINDDYILGTGFNYFLGAFLFRENQAAVLESPILDITAPITLRFKVDKTTDDAELWVCRNSLPVNIQGSQNCQLIGLDNQLQSIRYRSEASIPLSESDKKKSTVFNVTHLEPSGSDLYGV